MFHVAWSTLLLLFFHNSLRLYISVRYMRAVLAIVPGKRHVLQRFSWKIFAKAHAELERKYYNRPKAGSEKI